MQRANCPGCGVVSSEVHQHTRQWVLDVPVTGRVEVSGSSAASPARTGLPWADVGRGDESANRLILGQTCASRPGALTSRSSSDVNCKIDGGGEWSSGAAAQHLDERPGIPDYDRG